MNVLRMADQDLAGKRVLIREDLNVPVEGGKVTSDARIRASLPTIKLALDKGAKVFITSHLGRPEEGVYAEEFSLAPVAARLSDLLGKQVPLRKTGSRASTARRAARCCWRTCASTRARRKTRKISPGRWRRSATCSSWTPSAPRIAPKRRRMAWASTPRSPARVRCWWVSSRRSSAHWRNPRARSWRLSPAPKVSTKLTVLESLLAKVDKLIVGGGIANTFLAATGINVGKSLHEADMLDMARKLLEQAKARGAEIPLPTDVVVAKEFAATAHADVRSIHEVRPDELILDIGPDSAERFGKMLQTAGTIVWNGPVGVFEWDQFGEGTKAIAHAIARSPAFSLAGGGDTLAAIEKYGVEEDISYISTGGGAFLEFVEGKTLPAVAMLESSRQG
jgi:phosphoglycerate kinase